MADESNYWWKPDTSTDIVSAGSTTLDAEKLKKLGLEKDILKKQLAGPETYGGLTVGDWSTGIGMGLKAYDMFDPTRKEVAEKKLPNTIETLINNLK